MSSLRRALLCAAVAVLVLAAAALGEELQTEPDAASLFSVHGRTFWNKSLGYDRQPPGVLGHQCSSARPGAHPQGTLTYTANRRWPSDPALARSAIVMAVGGEPERFYSRFKDAWFEWRQWFAPDVRENTALVLLLDANYYADVSGVRDALKLEALDCAAHARACQIAAGLDQGYKVFVQNVYVDRRTGQNVAEPQEPFVVLIGVARFPAPFWIARANLTEQDVLDSDWQTPYCNHANYAYTKFTNWYCYHMLSELRVLDYFDFWWKIDDDSRWFGPLPLDITRTMAQKRAVFFQTAVAHDPWSCTGPALGESVQLYVDMESALCGRLLRPAAFDKHWFQNDTYIYYSEFVGGWLGLYASPELLQYARIWDNMPGGMWTWRWGDQQFWTKANGLFDDGSGILDLSYFKLHDPIPGGPLPDSKKTGLMFYHG